MKQIIVKLIIFLPILLFIDWIIMIVVGCATNFCLANTTFFNTIYYYFGIILVILTFSFLAVIMFNQPIHRSTNG